MKTKKLADIVHKPSLNKIAWLIIEILIMALDKEGNWHEQKVFSGIKVVDSNGAGHNFFPVIFMYSCEAEQFKNASSKVRFAMALHSIKTIGSCSIKFGTY